MKIVHAKEVPWFCEILLGYPKTMKIRNLQGNLTWKKKNCMTVFEVIGQFYYQEVFSEHEIRVFIENGFGNFQKFLFYRF
jgi:hypothetical protein